MCSSNADSADDTSARDDISDLFLDTAEERPPLKRRRKVQLPTFSRIDLKRAGFTESEIGSDEECKPEGRGTLDSTTSGDHTRVLSMPGAWEDITTPESLPSLKDRELISQYSKFLESLDNPHGRIVYEDGKFSIKPEQSDVPPITTPQQLIVQGPHSISTTRAPPAAVDKNGHQGAYENALNVPREYGSWLLVAQLEPVTKSGDYHEYTYESKKCPFSVGAKMGHSDNNSPVPSDVLTPPPEADQGITNDKKLVPYFTASQTFDDYHGPLWEEITEYLKPHYLHPGNLTKQEFIELALTKELDKPAWIAKSALAIKNRELRNYMAGYQRLRSAGIDPTWVDIPMFEFMTEKEQDYFIEQCQHVAWGLQIRQERTRQSNALSALPSAHFHRFSALWEAVLSPEEYQEFHRMDLPAKREFLLSHMKEEIRHFRLHEQSLIAERMNVEQYERFIHMTSNQREILVAEYLNSGLGQNGEGWDRLTFAVGYRLFKATQAPPDIQCPKFGLGQMEHSDSEPKKGGSGESRSSSTESCDSETASSTVYSIFSTLESEYSKPSRSSSDYPALRVPNNSTTSDYSEDLERGLQSRWSDSETEVVCDESSDDDDASVQGLYTRSAPASSVVSPLGSQRSKTNVPVLLSGFGTFKSNTDLHDDSARTAIPNMPVLPTVSGSQCPTESSIDFRHSARTETPDTIMPELSRMKTPFNSFRSTSSEKTLEALPEQVKQCPTPAPTTVSPLPPPYTHSPGCSKSSRISIADSPRGTKDKRTTSFSSKKSFGSISSWKKFGGEGSEKWGSVKKVVGKIFGSVSKRGEGKGSLSRIFGGTAGKGSVKSPKRGRIDNLF